jgi:hypothetical protein
VPPFATRQLRRYEVRSPVRETDNEYHFHLDEVHTRVVIATVVSPSCWITPIGDLVQLQVLKAMVDTLSCTVVTRIDFSLVNPSDVHDRSDGLQRIRNEQQYLEDGVRSRPEDY